MTREGWAMLILMSPLLVPLGLVLILFIVACVLATVAIIIRWMVAFVLAILGKEYSHWTEIDSPKGEFIGGTIGRGLCSV